MAAIAEIKAIDNHAHPLRALPEGQRDTEWGSLSYHAVETAADPGAKMPLIPYRLRPRSPEYMAAWRDLYGIPDGPPTKETLRQVVQAKRRIMGEPGDNYPAWVLDRIGIETMLANRVTMDGSLPAPRFRWVPYVDALMFPLSNAGMKKARPDLVPSYGGVERLLKTHLQDLGLDRLPPRLEGYLAGVVTPTMERQKRDGAVAVKFLTAYLRTLDVSGPSLEQARRTYNRYAKGGTPAPGEYKQLQDYLFRYIAREAGRLGLAVHIHTGIGLGLHFDVAGSNPLLLEPVFNDPALQETNFFITHGGWPFAKQSASMLFKANVYTDFSGIAFLNYPREVGDVLRSWLEVSPDKVLFGTDGFELDPDMPYLNWEEFTCIGNRGARTALALALTEMIRDGEISHEEAVGVARKVLRENAVKLYKLETP
ncbi:MAG: Amidohydrolase [Syntrophaceae bacterium PtaU1.Bin231]|nr:MAG: Amidohydrolase [Syntrophaceae bacterium PtaU1.Bin231]HOG16916.1 amidohydrolase family protein [Syntrophales bacterium]